MGAREGHWPQIFSMIHIRRQTPLPAVLLLVKCCLNTIKQQSWLTMFNCNCITVSDNTKQLYVHKMCLHKDNIWISDLKKLKVHLLDFFSELSTSSLSLHQQMAFDCLSISKVKKELSMYVGFETKTYNI